MAINKTITKYFETGSISFRALASTFGGTQPDGSIKFSTYKRDTESDDAIIPDAEENADISTDNNLSVETFRDTINEVVVTQSGTDEEVEFDSYFGTNIAKNIRKRLEISGTVFSNETDKFAATLTTTENIRNFDINVEGNIYGAGGASGSQGGDGGGSLYIQSGGSNRNFNLNIKSGAKLWAGGGGGSQGDTGSGSTKQCNQSFSVPRGATVERVEVNFVPVVQPQLPKLVPQSRTTRTTVQKVVPGTTQVVQSIRGPKNYNRTSPHRIARDFADRKCLRDGGWPSSFYAINPSDRRKCRRRGGMRGRARGQACANIWQFYCGVPQTITNPPTTKTKRGGAVTNTHFVFQPRPAITVQQERTTVQTSTRGELDQFIRNEDVSASGGSGGAGGHGEGFFSDGIRAAQPGSAGSAGQRKGCPQGYVGSPFSGAPGNSGTSGGAWGLPGTGKKGGKGGKFISYNGNITISGKSSNTTKGEEEAR